jgi:hypothetical protein
VRDVASWRRSLCPSVAQTDGIRRLMSHYFSVEPVICISASAAVPPTVGFSRGSK